MKHKPSQFEKSYLVVREKYNRYGGGDISVKIIEAVSLNSLAIKIMGKKDWERHCNDDEDLAPNEKPRSPWKVLCDLQGDGYDAVWIYRIVNKNGRQALKKVPTWSKS